MNSARGRPLESRLTSLKGRPRNNSPESGEMQAMKKPPAVAAPGGFGLTFGSEAVLDPGLNPISVVVVASDE